MANGEDLLELAVDRATAPELEAEQDYGTEIEEGGFYVAAARNPVCHDLRRVLEQTGAVSTQAIVLYERFRLWLVPHRLSVIRRKGLAEPTSIGIEVEYQAESGTCSVVDLLPGPRFIEHGSIDLNARVRGTITASGELLRSPSGGAAIEGTVGSQIGGLRFESKAEGGVALGFHAAVITPYVSAVGIGSSRAEWRFDKYEEALFGRDIETWTILAFPKRKKSLSYRMRFWLTARTMSFSTRRESDWLSITCAL